MTPDRPDPPACEQRTADRDRPEHDPEHDPDLLDTPGQRLDSEQEAANADDRRPHQQFGGEARRLACDHRDRVDRALNEFIEF